MRNYASFLESGRAANRCCLHLIIYICLYLDDIKKISLLCGNFTVGLYMYVHNKINNSTQYHTIVQRSNILLK